MRPKSPLVSSRSALAVIAAAVVTLGSVVVMVMRTGRPRDDLPAPPEAAAASSAADADHRVLLVDDATANAGADASGDAEHDAGVPGSLVPVLAARALGGGHLNGFITVTSRVFGTTRAGVVLVGDEGPSATGKVIAPDLELPAYGTLTTKLFAFDPRAKALVALSPESGVELWRTPLGELSKLIDVVELGDRIVVLGRLAKADGWAGFRTVALDAATHAPVWSAPNRLSTRLRIAGGRMFSFEGGTGSVYRLVARNVDTGSIAWRSKDGALATTIAANDTHLALSDWTYTAGRASPRRLSVYDAATGAKKSSLALGDDEVASLWLDDTRVTFMTMPALDALVPWKLRTFDIATNTTSAARVIHPGPRGFPTDDSSPILPEGPGEPSLVRIGDHVVACDDDGAISIYEHASGVGALVGRFFVGRCAAMAVLQSPLRIFAVDVDGVGRVIWARRSEQAPTLVRGHVSIETAFRASAPIRVFVNDVPAIVAADGTFEARVVPSGVMSAAGAAEVFKENCCGTDARGAVRIAASAAPHAPVDLQLAVPCGDDSCR